MPKDGMVSFGIEMTDGNTEYNIYTDMVEPVEGKENTYMATYMHPFEEYNGKCEIRAICTEGSVYDCYDGDECMFTFEFAGESCDYFKIKSISYADDFDGVVELTDEDDEKWVLHDRFGFALLYLLVKGTQKIKNKKIVP